MPKLISFWTTIQRFSRMGFCQDSAAEQPKTHGQVSGHEENTPLALKKKGLLLSNLGEQFLREKNASLQNDDWGKPTSFDLQRLIFLF